MGVFLQLLTSPLFITSNNRLCKVPRKLRVCPVYLWGAEDGYCCLLQRSGVSFIPLAVESLGGWSYLASQDHQPYWSPSRPETRHPPPSPLVNCSRGAPCPWRNVALWLHRFPPISSFINSVWYYMYVLVFFPLFLCCLFFVISCLSLLYCLFFYCCCHCSVVVVSLGYKVWLHSSGLHSNQIMLTTTIVEGRLISCIV